MTLSGSETLARKRIGPRTTNMIVGSLRQILRNHGKWEAIGKDYKKMAERKNVGRALSEDEQHRLLCACQKSRSRSLHPAWPLTLRTGLRHNETAQLKWSQVDLITGWVQVGASKTAAGDAGGCRSVATSWPYFKAGAPSFQKPYPGITYSRPRRTALDLGAGSGPPCRPHRPIKSWKTAWTTARKLSGVNCRWHDGRHCFISALAGSGVPDSVIMALAGHVEVEVMRLYSHTGNAAKRAAVAVFDRPAILDSHQNSPGGEEAPSTTVQ